MSPSEFLEWEREQEFKHEYVNGEVLAMSGASFNHNRIAINFIIKAGAFLEDKSYDIDATIICGEPEFDDEKMEDTLKNPAVIFDILSAFTEDYDIVGKQMFYLQSNSLKQYIIIDS